MSTDPGPEARWLVLVHQFAQGPGSLRVKIWRRLQSLGAVAIKNSVYALPMNEQSREDFQWVLRELTAGGADGAILESRLIDGMSDQQVRALFDAARREDYAQLIEELRDQLANLPADGDPPEELAAEARQALARARKRLAEIEAIDFFGAGGREDADRLVRELAERVVTPAEPPSRGASAMPELRVADLKHRVWVTRRNVRVDRIASAWLIRRWIDPAAVFKFTSSRDYSPSERELRFDMYEAEFTHRGELCTFEVLIDALGLDDPALRCVAEIVHDIDLKDQRYQRPETQGIANLLTGLVVGTQDDDQRIERGGALFEDLYRFFQQPTP